MADPVSTQRHVPLSVRIAGGLVAVEALAALAYTVALLIRALTVTGNQFALFGETGFFLIMTGAVGALAVGLIVGRRWTRTPSAVLQVLLIAVAWYALGPTNLVVPAVVTVGVCVATLVLLFTAPARAWAVEDRT